MNTTTTESTLDLKLTKLQQQLQKLGENAPPVLRSDKQRLQSAKSVFLKQLNQNMAIDIEACLHCGMCAEVCHFYESTKNAKYTPIEKVKPLKRFYQRELSPLRWLHRICTKDVSFDDLQNWQELVFDSCTTCGRCDLICPMGIEISSMVSVMRNGLAAADLAPDEFRELHFEHKQQGTVLGVGADQFKQLVNELEDQGVKIPVDKENAEVMVLYTALDVLMFNNSLASIAKILNKLGLDWSLYSNCYEAASKQIIETATANQIETLIIPECGHTYQELRWESETKRGEVFPFQVMAISEFIDQEVEAGQLKLNKIANAKTLSYHDPCKLGRHGGLFEEPRRILNALGIDIHETESNRSINYCCGGGSGVFLLRRAAPLRQRAFEIKKHEVDNTDAEAVVTSCDSCRLNFMVGAANCNWDKPVVSLVELVAANLADLEQKQLMISEY